MDQQFLLAYYVLPDTNVLLFSFPSEFPVRLHVTFLLLAVLLSRLFLPPSCESPGPLFGFCPSAHQAAYLLFGSYMNQIE